MAKNKYENLSEAEITALESRRLERKIKRRSEIKSFIILLLIVLIIGSGTWYWYTHIYDSERNKKAEDNTVEYEIVKYDATKSENYIKVGNYIALVNIGGNVEKLYDNNGKEYDVSKNNIIINDDEFNEANLMISYDNNLYAYQTEQSEYGSIVTIYKFTNNEFKKEIELEGDSFYYAKIVLSKDNENKLIGFAGTHYESDGEHEIGSGTFYYYILGKKIEKTNDFEFAGDVARISENQTYYTSSDTFITTMKGGLVNYKTGLAAIDDYYDGIYATNNNNYIACKDDKCGIIDSKQKQLTEMVYDFIDGRNKDFYVVSKDNKLAIMDSNYKVISDYGIPYEDGFNYKPCCGGPHYYYYSFKSDTTYYIIATTNIEDYWSKAEDTTADLYQITKDGKTTRITNATDLVRTKEDTTSKTTIYYQYDIDKKELTIYDYYKKMYTINNVPTEDGYLYIDLLDDNNLQIGYTNKKYYDYKTGTEIEKPQNYVLEDNGLKIEYDYDKSTLTINSKEDNTYNIDSITKNNIYKNDNNYYIVSNKYLIFINNKGK